MADKKFGKFLVQQVSKREMKSNRKYLNLKLLESGGRSWNAIFWEDRELEPGVVVDLVVEEGEYQGQTQLTVHALRVLKDHPIDEFLPKTPHSIEGLYEELLSFVQEITGEHLKRLVTEVVKDPRWKRTPAASNLHHAYIGGLLEHTVCLLRLSRAMADLYPQDIRRDYLYVAAIIHDMGKMNEIGCDINMSYTTEGELLGHITIGMLKVNSIMDDITENEKAQGTQLTSFGTLDEPTDARLIVLHMLGSHHGNPQYGAIKPPMTVEAQVFSNLDGMDATLAKIRAVKDRTPADRAWTDKARWDEPKIYIGEVKKP